MCSQRFVLHGHVMVLMGGLCKDAMTADSCGHGLLIGSPGLPRVHALRLFPRPSALLCACRGSLRRGRATRWLSASFLLAMESPARGRARARWPCRPDGTHGSPLRLHVSPCAAISRARSIDGPPLGMRQFCECTLFRFSDLAPAASLALPRRSTGHLPRGVRSFLPAFSLRCVLHVSAERRRPLSRAADSRVPRAGPRRGFQRQSLPPALRARHAGAACPLACRRETRRGPSARHRGRGSPEKVAANVSGCAPRARLVAVAVGPARWGALWRMRGHERALAQLEVAPALILSNSAWTSKQRPPAR
jgi:hypothetical protein